MKQNFTSVAGYRIRYIEDGISNEKHIICLHGLGGSAGRWAKALPLLGKEYHVVAPDMLGFGYSDKPDEYYTIDFFVDFVRKFARKMKLRKLALIGASLGGHIAIETALKEVDVVENLVLISPGGIMKESTVALNHYIAAAMYPTFENAKKALQGMGGTKEVDEAYTADFVNRMQLPNAKYAFMSSLMGSKAAPNLAERLHEINVSTLLVWGKKDALIPVKFAEKFHKGIRNSKLVILEDEGHTPYFDNPEKFCEIALDFLRN